MPVLSTPKVFNSSNSSPSTLISPFAILANIRSSNSLLRTSNSEMILMRRNSALNTSPNLPHQSNIVSRSSQLNFDKNLTIEDKEELQKKLTQKTIPISTRFSNEKNNDFQNKSNQTRCAVYLKNDNKLPLNDDKITDVYKFSSDSLLENKNLILTSSPLSLKTISSNRKRSSCGPYTNNYVQNKDFNNTLSLKRKVNNSATKKIRLSRHICKQKKLVDDNFEIVFGDKFSPSKNNKKFGTVITLDSGNKLEVKDTSKSQQSRGIWNFVSSVFSKYMF